MHLCVHNVLIRADTLHGQVGGGWALEIENFLGPVKWHRADWRVPFGAQKTNPPLYCALSTVLYPPFFSPVFYHLFCPLSNYPQHHVSIP
jgi:hypothetical protein